MSIPYYLAKLIISINDWCINSESRIFHEFSIPPQAVLELGLVELELNNGVEAEKWLKKCTQDYSNYTNENFVHLRAYAALRELGVSTDKQTVNQNMCLYS